MSNSDDNESRDRNIPARLKHDAEAIADQYGELQAKWNQAAQEAGYGQREFIRLAKTIENIPNDALLEPLGRIFNRHSEYLTKLIERTDIPKGIAQSAYIAVSSAASTSATVVHTLNLNTFMPNIGFTPDPPPFSPQNYDTERTAKLQKISPELAKVYSSVLEVLYATHNNPERAAMWQMRQFIVQFFDLLAPGIGKKVSHSQTIEYAAKAHIKDQTVAELRAAEATNIVAIYERLNEAHSRSAIDAEFARRTIRNAKMIMDAWIDDITVPK